MDTFDIREMEGRERLANFLTQNGVQKIVPTTNKYDEVDMYARIKDKKYVFEIKVRSKIYDEIILSTNKVVAIEDRIKRYDLDGGFYACFYENSLYLFDTVHCPKRLGYQYCPKTTSGYDNHYVQREVYYFDIKDAYKYEYSNNTWSNTYTPQYNK